MVLERFLDDVRILVTRPAAQARALVQDLEKAGARVTALPTIKTVAPPDWQPADRAIENITSYNYLVFSSVNAVAEFHRRLRQLKSSITEIDAIPIFAVGPKTAAALAKKGLQCRQVAKEFAAEGLLELFAKENIKGRRILIPRALQAREKLPEKLREAGATVDVVPVYQTIFPPESAAALSELLAADNLDLITLTSTSTAVNLVDHCGPRENLLRLKKLPCACIGPITARAAQQAGLRVAMVADQYTSEGLLAALKQHFSSHPD